MGLNYIWVAFFLIAFVVALIRLLFGDAEFIQALFNAPPEVSRNVFQTIVATTFDMAKTAVEISIGLIGIITLWLGLMKIGEKGGVIKQLSRIINPFFKKLFPEIPKDHPAFGSIMMNFSANMLGLDNAATPLGLKAMKDLQELNPEKETASNAQIMFLVLNTAGLTLIPISIIMLRAQLGALNPSDIFLPIILATYFGTLAGMVSVAIYQKINLLDRVLLSYIGGFTLFICGLIYYFSTLPQDTLNYVSVLVSNIVIFGIIITFILLAFLKKVNVYEAFIEGAKEGFNTAIMIIPYLVAILVAIAVFRASGSMDLLIGGIKYIFIGLGVNADFIPALPTALMKSLSGSGARGLMVDTMKTFGADSFPGRLASIFQGSSDTTFYIIAVYFGSVGIRKTRYAITCGLIADFFGIIAAIFIGYLFFH